MTLDPRLQALLGLLGRGRDDALLRFGLGQAYLAAEDAAPAITHLEAAVVHNPAYSAAWKLLGQAYVAVGDREGAIKAYTRGIEAATAHGDVQAGKEMRVFRARLERPPS